MGKIAIFNVATIEKSDWLYRLTVVQILYKLSLKSPEGSG